MTVPLPLSAPLFVIASLFVVATTCNNMTDYRKNCVSMRFKKNSICDDKIVVSEFVKQNFNFTDATDLNAFAQWIDLMLDVEQYSSSSSSSSKTVAAVAHHLEKFVQVDGGITRELQLLGDAVYQNVANLYINYHSVLRFKENWLQYQYFFNNYIIWAPSRFKTVLATYAHLRSSLRYSRSFVAEVDDAAVRVMVLALNYPLATMRPEHVRQEAYIYYVSKLSPNDRQRFNGGLYETIEMQQFPHTTILRSGPVNITLHHNIQNLSVLNRMQEESDFVYDNFKNLWQRLNLSFVHTIRNVDMYVYENRSEYIRTGLLMTINVNNGGIALYQFKPQKVQASVYFEGDMIPRAFGHELFHCLLYTSNRRVIHTPNSHWYLEGAANRFGYRKCFWRDYFDLRNYQHKTIDEIVRADYENKILYPMGSALVSFLYEKRPELLKNAVLRRNYTIPSDAQLENEFTTFKQNKLAECNYVNKNNKYRYKNKVQQLYAQIISNDTFKHCRNYIAVRFSDCVFILTPTKLYLENGVNARSIINPQKIIRFNRNEVSQFDFDFLQKGLIKLAARMMLHDPTDPTDVVNKFFSVDDKYTYGANVSCNNVDTLTEIVLRLPLLRTERTPLSAVASKQIAKMMVQKYEKLSFGCRVFVSPPVNATGRLRLYVERLLSLRDEHIADVNLKKPLDARANTIIHLAAIYNKHLFLRMYRYNNDLVSHLTNNRNETGIWLFENSQRYLQRFNHEPNRYCMSVVPGNITFAYPPTIAKKIISSRRGDDDAAAVVIDNNHNNVSRGNQTRTDNKDSNKGKISVESVKVALLSITVLVVVLTVVGISCNTLVTITIVKHYNNKTNNLISSTLQYNKQKFYVNDETTLPLFN
ncbi:hypothetical protein [Alphabaculovirus altersperidaniae]|uniref:Uncharacterized protein n=1 Tax=Spodoptera eridania nucleopolyhedrovirus TaxID=2315721 RepID=A0ABX6TQC5_9ABAC|nr:hypothetical protein QKS47_gp032 [Spodoptera eridania nucleopolyhedrovirus]QNV47860.1 hypothetical protein [Spodoptera eridania nucleopolyhedrovirus]